MENVLEVSKWLISNGSGMSYPSKSGNLKLQKLLYYADAMSLSVYDEPLFSNDIIAWEEGPVVKAAYVHYRYYNLWSKKSNSIGEKAIKILNVILDLFDEFSGEELKLMTHDDIIWKKYENEIEYYKDIIIESSDIKKYFFKEFNLLFNDYFNEKSIKIGDNIFLYNPQETELTEEDKKILQKDFENEKQQELFVFKEDGELIAY